MTRRLEVAVVAVGLAALALGIALQPLLSPGFTRVLTGRYSDLPRSQSAVQAEVVRRFVTGDQDAGATLRNLMPAEAVSHLDDVRDVVRGANITAAILAVLAGAWVAFRLVGKRPEIVAAALRGGAVLSVGLVLLSGVAGAADFDTLFARFHALFFAEGTWTFPSDSLIIRLFPLEFWIAAGVSWAGLTVVVGAGYALAASGVRCVLCRSAGD